MSSDNNKRIAKNTALLYIRMLLTMSVSLYVSRVILDVLGVEDFGIYNIVGGVVVLFSFLNTAMSSATQRFLNFEIGRCDTKQQRKVFNTSLFIHISIALLILLLLETIGYWFVNTHLNLPINRMNAVNWIYQFSVFTFILNVIRVPYNACIIAHEKMAFYAYVSILEVSLKLITVLVLVYMNSDKLILYAIFIGCISLIMFIVYKTYCSKKFEICHFHLVWDSSLLKKLISFTGWSLFGSLANVTAQQGLSILLNLFWGVTVNAAMGIANQVSSAIYAFVSNFQVAFNPQIVKSYASDDKKYFMELIFQASKFSYYLLLILSIPILICTEFMLNIWLNNVPDYTVSFCRLIIAFLLIDSISAPLWMSVQATGKIKNYQILMGMLILLNFPLAYIVLKIGYPPQSVLVIRVLVNLLTYIVRIFYLRNKINLPVKQYAREVVLVAVLVSVLALPIPMIINQYTSSWSGLFLTSSVAILFTSLLIYVIGLKRNEKEFLTRIILNKIKR